MNFLDESLDFWMYIKEDKLAFTPDILEYANETHFIELFFKFLLNEKVKFVVPDENLFRNYVSENKHILDHLYICFYNFFFYVLKNIVGQVNAKHRLKYFSKIYFYYWCM